MLEELSLSHVPPELTLYVACYKDVQNANYLRQQLLSANQAFNYAFVDATTILSRRHLLAACFRAMSDYIHDRLKSNNVQSEIVFCLSPNNNIGDAFRRFGIQDSSKDIVVVKVGDSAASEANVTKQGVEEHLSGAIEGTPVDFSDDWLKDVCDVDKVRKNYKIAKPQQQGKGEKIMNDDGTGRDERLDMETQVLGFMALRGAT